MASYYKLLKTQFAESLVTRGNVRITTFERCKVTETAGKGRADSAENQMAQGVRFLFSRAIPEGREHELPFRDWIHKEGYQPLPKDPRFPTPGVRIYGRLPRMAELKTRDNSFLYCVSDSQSPSMERDLSEGDDAWVEIFNPDAFFAALTAHMASLGHVFKSFGQVTYRPRYIHPDEPRDIDPAFM